MSDSTTPFAVLGAVVGLALTVGLVRSCVYQAEELSPSPRTALEARPGTAVYTDRAGWQFKTKCSGSEEFVGELPENVKTITVQYAGGNCSYKTDPEFFSGIFGPPVDFIPLPVSQEHPRVGAQYKKLPNDKATQLFPGQEPELIFFLKKYNSITSSPVQRDRKVYAFFSAGPQNSHTFKVPDPGYLAYTDDGKPRWRNRWHLYAAYNYPLNPEVRQRVRGQEVRYNLFFNER